MATLSADILTINQQPSPIEYFALTKFQDRANQIFCNPQWYSITYDRDSVLLEREDEQIVAGVFYPRDGKEAALVLGAVYEMGNRKYHGEIYECGQSQAQHAVDVIRDCLPCLPAQAREEYVKWLIERQDEWVRKDPIPLYKKVIEVMPERFEGVEHEESQYRILPPDFVEVVVNAGKKVPFERIERYRAYMSSTVRFLDAPFDRNLGLTIINFVRHMTEDDFDPHVVRMMNPEVYTIRDKVTRPLTDELAFGAELQQIPVEQVPSHNILGFRPPVAEMVTLDNVVGGTNIENWAVHPSDHGEYTVFSVAKKFASGEWILGGTTSPIVAKEMGGKLFVTGDGRLRVAALKGLGVREVPILVEHEIQ